MKAFLIFVGCAGLAAAALFAPICGRSFWTRAQERGLPRAAARLAAHGLRAGWDSFASLKHGASSPGASGGEPGHSPRPLSRREQANAAQPALHRASREGIVAQPPKEKLEQTDRAALDKLVAGGAERR